MKLEGLCVSPIDFPAKWAVMIFGYFDESGCKDKPLRRWVCWEVRGLEEVPQALAQRIGQSPVAALGRHALGVI